VKRQRTRFLTVREVARAFKIAISTVYKLCAEGEFGHTRVSNAIRLPAVELESLLAVRRGHREGLGRDERRGGGWAHAESNRLTPCWSR
jgi:excisionase family DNA binding protein